jgi:hypothetical protein
MAGNNIDGKYFVTDVDQENDLGKCGRVWIKTLGLKGASRWRWIGCGSIGQAAKLGVKLVGMTGAEIDEYYDRA